MTGGRTAARKPSRLRARVSRLFAGALLGLLVPVLPVPTAMAPAASAQVAQVSMVVTPSFPTTVSVGLTGEAAHLEIVNTSSGVGPVTLSSITLNPACADTSVPTVSCLSPDLGVLQLSQTATGSGGSCNGTAFSIVGPGPDGTSSFVSVGSVVLQPTGANASCFIDFTFNVLKAPTDADPDADLQTRQFATVAGSALTPITRVGSGAGASVMTIGLRQPTVTTRASDSVTVGSPIFDTATLTNGQLPTGTMTFLMYGPDVPDCPGVASEGPPVRVSPRQAVIVPDFRSDVPVDGNGAYVSDPYTPTEPGLYRWYAFYGGDENNYPTNPSCEDPLEEVLVNPGQVTTTIPTTTTTIPPGVTTTSTTVVGPPFLTAAPTAPVAPVAPMLSRTGPSVAVQIGFALLLVVIGAHLVLETWRRGIAGGGFSG